MIGIDGNVEVEAALNRLSSTSEIAAHAPRATALYRYLQQGMLGGGRFGNPTDYLAFATALIQDLGIWWPPSLYAELPVLVPWAVRDRSARYDMGPEMWSAPRADGYLRDDNSIIKKLPLPLRVRAGAGHPYAERKPWRGFVACHLWRDLPDGSVAGTSPWLYSFVPNLVWLPMPIARLSDLECGPIQYLLQRTSLAVYREVVPLASVEPYTANAWARLPQPPPGPMLDLANLNYFMADDAFVERRIAYIDQFLYGAESVLATGTLKRKLLSTRYTEGFPKLAPAAIQKFAYDLAAYRAAVRANALSAQ